MTPGERVQVRERGQHGTDVWEAVYLGPVAPGWCEIRRLQGGGVHRVPVRCVGHA